MNVAVETKQVTVKTLSVDGRNMSKAFFKQIPIKEYSFDMKQDGIEILGTVVEQVKYGRDYSLVFTLQGMLYRKTINLSGPVADFNARYNALLEKYGQLYIGA